MAFEGSEVVFTLVFERFLEALERPLGGPLGNLDLLRPLGAFEAHGICGTLLGDPQSLDARERNPEKGCGTLGFRAGNNLPRQPALVARRTDSCFGPFLGVVVLRLDQLG